MSVRLGLNTEPIRAHRLFDFVNRAWLTDRQKQMDNGGISGHDSAMQITVKQIKVSQAKPGGDLVVTHESKAGAVRINVPAMQLHRWLLRAIRAEMFK